METDLHHAHSSQRARSAGRVVAAAVACVLLFPACGSETAARPANDWSPAATEPPADAPVRPSLAVGPVAVGHNRLAFGLVDEGGSLVDDAEVTATLWTLADAGDGEMIGTEVATHALTRVALPQDYQHEHADGSDHLHDARDATVYVAEVEFDRPEWWGAELSITIDGELLAPMRVPFWVDADTPEPAVGERIPASRQPTTADTEIELIDSADPPRPELHDRTIADALAENRPLMVVFATAAFCQTQFCGPVLDGVAIPLSEQYGDRMEFIVVEPFDLEMARQGELVPMSIMNEWGLASEPWIFVTDADGVVTHRFQGITSLDEVRAAVEQVLAG